MRLAQLCRAMAERHTAHGYWLEDAGPVDPAPRLQAEVTADVVVVGGGYTGMWAAWHAKQLEPEAHVVLVEAGRCAIGPSGRNGGFVNTMWHSLPAMRGRYGDEAAIAVARAGQGAVDEVGRFCAEQEVDASFRHAGYLQVSTAPGYDDEWLDTVDSCRQLGEPDACRPLSPEAVSQRCASPIFRGGAFYPGAATVHPVRLARGLLTRLRDVGVSVFEESSVQRLRSAAGEVSAETEGGRVRARSAVLGVGGKLPTLGPVRRRLTLTSSHMVMTEPVPDVLEELGWTGGECITDSRHLLHYFRTTADGRIGFGWGGGRVLPGARLGGRAEVDPVVVAEVERQLRRFFPGLEGRRIEHAWGGPIDVSPTHLPFVGSVAGQPVHYAAGYTGNGVGPSHLMGRILASLALDRHDEPTRLAIVDPAPVKVPPEPFRYVGGIVVRNAMRRREAALEQGRRPSAVSSFVAGIPERIGIHVGR